MSEPIRVLHIFSALNAGGVENFVMNTYRRIDRSRVQYDFAMTSGKKALYDEEVLSLGGRIFYLEQNAGIAENLKRLFAQHHFDAVHSHIFFYSGLVLREAKKAAIPVRIAHAHNAYTGEGRSLPRRGYELLMRALIFQNATAMLGCSEKACRYVFGSRCFRDRRVSVLPDGIDCGRFAYRDAVRAEMRRSLGLDGRFVVGHAGHFVPAKNHEKILSVFAQLCRIRGDAALLLVGDGALEASVRAMSDQLGIADRVIFAGARSDIEKYYQAMDVFLFPSRYEGFGMAMIEAQSGGLSCVASDVVPPETDVSGHCRYLPLNASDEAWAAALCDMPGRTQTTDALKKYDIHTVTQTLFALYGGSRK